MKTLTTAALPSSPVVALGIGVVLPAQAHQQWTLDGRVKKATPSKPSTGAPGKVGTAGSAPASTEGSAMDTKLSN